MKHSFWVIATILLLEVAFIALMVSPDWVKSMALTEGRSIVASLGQETAFEIQAKANGWYTALIIDTGFKETLFHALIPTEQERLNSRGLEHLGEGLWPYVANRITTFTLMLYWLMMRFAQFLMWVPSCIPAIIAAFVAGRYRRMIKQASFEKASGIMLRYSWRTAGLAVSLFFLAFLLPWSIPPWVFPIIIFGALVTVGLSIGNITKRI